MRPARAFGLTLAAVLLFQACWILVVPPFRGADEYRHVYKAWAVAHGDLSPTHPAAPEGSGSLMVVDRSLVEAALPVCESLHLRTDYCPPAGDAGGDNVYASTTAATYDPLYYFVAGTAGRWWHGYGSLYAMRIATAILCASLLAVAAAITARWARTPWPMVALIAAITPEVVYSTSIVAPNGVEMALAAVVWTALLGLVRSRSPQPWYVAAATAAAVPLVMVRTLGPMWLLLIVAVTALLADRERIAAILRLHATRVGAALVALATAGGVAWTLAAHANFPSSNHTPQGSLVAALVVETAVWLGQAYAAFPGRVEYAPSVVYGTEVLLIATAITAVVASRVRRVGVAMGALAVVGLAIPVVATLGTWHHGGVVWQGRYGLPLLIGFFLLAGFALDVARGRHGRIGVALVAGATCVVQVASLRHVQDRQLATSPLAHTDSWVVAPTAVIVAIALLGGASLLLGTKAST